MKQIYFTVIGLICAIYSTTAQTISFADPNFKAKLLQSSTSNNIATAGGFNYIKIDANNNGEIEVSEVLPVKMLNIGNGSISSLAGIEYFTNLEFLYCDYNQITQVDLAALQNLQSFFCRNNTLTSVAVAGLQ
ncbi:MAG: leucine-rich repeat domain-containing protein, partial [Flavobacterium sp.]|nr:leucine-rich repeat domain-containing protein [Flavobacterium sp.]